MSGECAARPEQGEVRVRAKGRANSYITICGKLLRQHGRVQLRGSGQAIPKTVMIAEILKRRCAGLHQVSELKPTHGEDCDDLEPGDQSPYASDASTNDTSGSDKG